MFSICSRAQMCRSILHLLYFFPPSTPKVGRAQVQDSCPCPPCTAESWLCGSPFSITPLCLVPGHCTYYTFNQLLAIANLPPSPGVWPISVVLLLLESSSAHGHSCIFVSLTDGFWWFQVPRDKRLLSVSKASDNQEDQDKRYRAM